MSRDPYAIGERIREKHGPLAVVKVALTCREAFVAQRNPDEDLTAFWLRDDRDEVVWTREKNLA